MPKAKKPASPPKKLSAMDKMIQNCVKKARERKRDGETDREWRKEYSATLKVDSKTAPLSQTPFDGSATKKKD